MYERGKPMGRRKNWVKKINTKLFGSARFEMSGQTLSARKKETASGLCSMSCVREQEMSEGEGS